VKEAKPEKIVEYPNYGTDHDIEASIQHLKDAEAALGKWDIKPSKSDSKA